VARYAVFVVAGALCLLAPVRALGWNNVGHMTIAKLAYDQLTAGQKQAIADVLRKHPHYAVYLRANRPEGVGEDEWAFLRASVWPDWVRPSKRDDTRGEEVTRYNIGPDHYINKPFILPADRQLFADKDLRPDPRHNVLAALERRFAELKSTSTPAEDRAVALCWLLHLVGDVQQPLHCTSLLSATFADKDERGFFPGDRGGNLFYVKVGGRPWRLHAFWDDLPGTTPGGFGDTTPNMAKVFELVRQNIGTLAGPDFRREGLSELEKAKSFSSWVDEGNELGKTAVYLNGELKGVRIDAVAPADVPEAPADYERKSTALARRRMALGGYRLLDKLREAIPAM
jgi:hypothetical protein